MDKGLIKTLGNLNRPYSIVEAMFCHQYNIDCGKKWTYRGYAKLWQWSVNRVIRFIVGATNECGTVAERKGNSSGTLVRFVFKDSRMLKERMRDSIGTVAERNIKPKEQTLNKKKKNGNASFDARKFLAKKGIENQIITDWLQVRKAKRLANTMTAFQGVFREIEKTGESATEILRYCCVKGWGGFKASWDRSECFQATGGHRNEDGTYTDESGYTWGKGVQ